MWFRYGPAEHTELFHAIPDIVFELSKTCEVHYFGFKSKRPLPPLIQEHATIHSLPFYVDRTVPIDKWIKTLLWIAVLPLLAWRCKKLNIEGIYIDETIPLAADIAQRFFGKKVAISVADFFVDIYLSPSPMLRPIANGIRKIDLNSWKKCPVVFTRAKATKTYLSEQGLNPQCIYPVYDPCDMKIYFPMDKMAAKKKISCDKDKIYLVHHGILHPNKGNDKIIEALSTLRNSHPKLQYLLIGDGPDSDRLKQLTHKLNLQHSVRFTGWLPERSEVNVALNAGDIGLVMRLGQPSDHFHTTGALVHNMACGLPILAARLGGISDIIKDGENGFLFDPINMDEFIEKLVILMNNAKLREAFGKKAHQLAMDIFHMEKVTKQTVQPLLLLLKELKS